MDVGCVVALGRSRPNMLELYRWLKFESELGALDSLYECARSINML